jgi:hypothetical protein
MMDISGVAALKSSLGHPFIWVMHNHDRLAGTMVTDGVVSIITGFQFLRQDRLAK